MGEGGRRNGSMWNGKTQGAANKTGAELSCFSLFSTPYMSAPKSFLKLLPTNGELALFADLFFMGLNYYYYYYNDDY